MCVMVEGARAAATKATPLICESAIHACGQCVFVYHGMYLSDEVVEMQAKDSSATSPGVSSYPRLL